MSTDSYSCMETTSADWVFSVTVSSAAVVLFTAAMWLSLLSLAKSPPEPAPPVSAQRRWTGLAMRVFLLPRPSTSLGRPGTSRTKP